MPPTKNTSLLPALLLAIGLLGHSHALAQTLPPDPSAFPFTKPVARDQVPASMPYTGDFNWALQWKEGDKRQVLIASEVQHPSELRNDIHLVQYGFGNGKYGLVWALTEFAPKLCRADLLEKTLQVIDLDGDGKHEVCFGYRVQHPEGEPSLLKLMLYHQGEKLAVRAEIHEEEALKGVEKSIVEEERQVLGWYLERRWQAVAAGKEPYVDRISLRGEGWFLLESRSLEGLPRTFYDLRMADGSEVELDEATRNRLQYARAIYPGPAGKLMYVSDDGVGLVHPGNGSSETLLDLPETTEGISTAAWSPDSSKVALVVLDVDAYPKSTRLYILDLTQADGHAPPEQFDLLISHYGFDVWTIEPPVFVDDRTVKVLEVGWDEQAEGTWREIGIR